MYDGIINRDELKKFNLAGYLASADMYTSRFSAKKGTSRFRITACMSAAGILRLNVYDPVSATASNEALNMGNALVADAVYSWDVPVTSNYTYNMQYSVNTTIKRIQIDEIVQES